jgi:hypothetical protein
MIMPHEMPHEVQIELFCAVYSFASNNFLPTWLVFDTLSMFLSFVKENYPISQGLKGIYIFNHHRRNFFESMILFPED